jgi:hypothetical protein
MVVRGAQNIPNSDFPLRTSDFRCGVDLAVQHLYSVIMKRVQPSGPVANEN